jgi:DNA-binding MarR family transcriptional regulator
MPKATVATNLEALFTYRMNTLNKRNDMASHAQYVAQLGLTLTEARTLAVVGSITPMTVNRLALEVALDKAQASRVAVAMQTKGLIERQGHATDKRVVQLTLTRAGRAKWKQVMALVRERNDALMACLTNKERDLLLEMFARMLAQAGVADVPALASVHGRVQPL